nr:unnamed protein product [Digitaria exilis]
MAHLLPPSSETLFPNRMWRPAKIPRLARPMTTLRSGSMSFTVFIRSAGSFPSPPTRCTTFLYISLARNDILAQQRQERGQVRRRMKGGSRGAEEAGAAALGTRGGAGGCSRVWGVGLFGAVGRRRLAPNLASMAAPAVICLYATDRSRHHAATATRVDLPRIIGPTPLRPRPRPLAPYCLCDVLDAAPAVLPTPTSAVERHGRLCLLVVVPQPATSSPERPLRSRPPAIPRPLRFVPAHGGLARRGLSPWSVLLLYATTSRRRSGWLAGSGCAEGPTVAASPTHSTHTAPVHLMPLARGTDDAAVNCRWAVDEAKCKQFYKRASRDLLGGTLLYVLRWHPAVHGIKNDEVRCPAKVGNSGSSSNPA